MPVSLALLALPPCRCPFRNNTSDAAFILSNDAAAGRDAKAARQHAAAAAAPA